MARRGNRVVTLDLLGHGGSDQPHDPAAYSKTRFGRQVIALLDHLEVSEAIIGGTSLGASVTLEAALPAPQRVRAMVVEMPVLENALIATRSSYCEGLSLDAITKKRRVPTASNAIAAPRFHERC